MASLSEQAPLHPGSITARFNAWLCGVLGYLVLAACAASAASLLTWQIADPSLTHAASGPVQNVVGPIGAIFSDLIMQLLGLAGVFAFLPPVFWALQMIGKGRLDNARVKLMLAPVAVVLLACAASSLPRIAGWPLPYNVGGVLGDTLLRAVTNILAMIRPERASAAAGLFCFAGGMTLMMTSLGLSQRDLKLICQAPRGRSFRLVARAWQRLGEMSERATLARREPRLDMPVQFAPAGSPMPPVYHQAPPQHVFVPAPHVHAPARPYTPEIHCDGGTFDNETDRRKLDRILSICAPENAGKKGGRRGNDLLIQPDIAPEPVEPYAPHDPIAAAQNVTADPQQHYPVRVPPAPAPFHESAHGGAAWPLQTPAPAPRQPMAPSPDGWRPQNLPGGDDLYGRAVAIVLDDRRASADYLQQRLAIGYMRASDLIDRMEREGILGAPVYNGMRPILMGGPGSREI